MGNICSNFIKMSEKEIEKFISLYGEGDGSFSLELVIPEPGGNEGGAGWRNKHWGTRWFSDDGNDSSVQGVLRGEGSFSTVWAPPIPVYEKMAADGLEFTIHWDGEGDIGIGNGRGKGGKFWHCLDFEATRDECLENDERFDLRNYPAYINHVDVHGNRCELDTTRVRVYGCADGPDVFALPVKKMIEGGKGDGNGGAIFKIPPCYKGIYEAEGIETDGFSDELRCHAGSADAYLLDKSGKHITAITDFDHSDSDADGAIFYPVPANDLEDGDSYSPLTPEAVAKWKAKLGL